MAMRLSHLSRTWQRDRCESPDWIGGLCGPSMMARRWACPLRKRASPMLEPADPGSTLEAASVLYLATLATLAGTARVFAGRAGNTPAGAGGSRHCGAPDWTTTRNGWGSGAAKP
jgi:hypothetical protein